MSLNNRFQRTVLLAPAAEPRLGTLIMKYILFSLLLITTNLRAEAGEAPALPKPVDVFAITIEPTRNGVGTANQESRYFTSQSLIQSLSTFQPIEDPHDARPLDMYQKGVIALKNKTVLFWLACSADYFIIKKQDGTFWFYGRRKT